MTTNQIQIAELKKLASDYVYNVTRRNYCSINNDFENRNHHENQINVIKVQINKVIEAGLITLDEMTNLIHNTTVQN